MKFEEFLKKVSHKIGAKGAFDLARDAKLNAIIKMLIKKDVISQEEWDKIIEENLDKIAKDIENMPPSPKKNF